MPELERRVAVLERENVELRGVLKRVTDLEYRMNTHLHNRVDLTQEVQGRVSISVKVFNDTTAATTGDGKFIFAVPFDLDGRTLERALGYVTGASTSGALVVQVRNVTTGLDLLSTPITIDQSENTSATSSAPMVVAKVNGKVRQDQLIAIDVDSAGTSAEGLGVVLTFS